MKMSFLYWCFKTLFKLLFKTFFRLRTCNAERVPASGPVILAANHASFLDPPLVGTAVPRFVSILARKSLFNKPILGALFRNWRVVPVDRDGAGAAGLKAILTRLKQRGAVLLFPEGTRTFNGRIQPAKPGIGLMILKTRAPVVPVRVFGSFKALGRHNYIPRPTKITVKFGHPMYFETERAEAAGADKPHFKELCERVANSLMRQIASLEPVEDKTTFP
ncbi:MAG: 1-acyl-sn-glycerol-3-phosphate acyltransferase [Verrucomicrobia bacterium]|nr:1-acyl-sn-glycerol-3-phosphate acyltransferase [Verrucomicrobiota bacterium]MCF7707973.1 1-acyl-sn-glycerol-3-phosphate acyltransferase [Verrucomicrobiota bacterium]